MGEFPFPISSSPLSAPLVLCRSGRREVGRAVASASPPGGRRRTVLALLRPPTLPPSGRRTMRRRGVEKGTPRRRLCTSDGVMPPAGSKGGRGGRVETEGGASASGDVQAAAGHALPCFISSLLTIHPDPEMVAATRRSHSPESFVFFVNSSSLCIAGISVIRSTRGGLPEESRRYGARSASESPFPLPEAPRSLSLLQYPHTKPSLGFFVLPLPRGTETTQHNRGISDAAAAALLLLVSSCLFHAVPSTHPHTADPRPANHKPSLPSFRYEMGRPPANTKLSSNVTVRTVRTRGGNTKFRALRLDHGNFSWGSEVRSPAPPIPPPPPPPLPCDVGSPAAQSPGGKDLPPLPSGSALHLDPLFTAQRGPSRAPLA